MIFYYCSYYKKRLSYHKVIKACLKRKCDKIRMYNKLYKQQNTFKSLLDKKHITKKNEHTYY